MYKCTSVCVYSCGHLCRASQIYLSSRITNMTHELVAETHGAREKRPGSKDAPFSKRHHKNT